MAGTQKHGGHLVSLFLPNLAAGSANDIGNPFVYRGFPAGSAAVGGDVNASVDWAQDQIIEANFSTQAALTGQATNFASIVLQQRRPGGTVLNDIRVVFSAAGVATAAYVPANLGVASGATVTGAGTGTLTVQTGAALPWTLLPGDIIVAQRISNNATGLATPAFTINLFIAAVGT